MNHDVFVIGVGCVSTAGVGPELLERAHRSGTRPGVSAEWAHAVPEGQPIGAIDDFDPAAYVKMRGLRPLSRASRLAVVAAAAALGHPDPIPGNADRAGVVVGSRWGSIESIVEFNKSAYLDGPHLVNPSHFPNVVANVHAGYLGILFGLAGPNLTLCGASAGLEAIGQGAELLGAGRAGPVLAGGVEALGASLLRGGARAGRLVGGLVPGEGAAFLLLTGAVPADRVPLARVAGWSVVTAHRATDLVAARNEAIRDALEGAGVPLESVETVWITGEDAGTFVAPPGLEERVHSLREITGDCEAADGALAAALAIHGITKGAGPTLVGCFPPVGNQVVVLFTPMSAQERLAHPD